MNRDDVIRMALEAGFQEGWLNLWAGNFERFAALVAAAEREACAQTVERMTQRMRVIHKVANSADAVEPCEYAAAIRARKD